MAPHKKYLSIRLNKSKSSIATTGACGAEERTADYILRPCPSFSRREKPALRTQLKMTRQTSGCLMNPQSFDFEQFIKNISNEKKRKKNLNVRKLDFLQKIVC